MSGYLTKRNKFIARAALRFATARPHVSPSRGVRDAVNLADALESVGRAPWLPAPTPLSDMARRVVEAAVAAYDDAHDMNVRGKLWDAVLAYKESVK